MQLLVSVRSAEEAQLAGNAGVDRIDLKEPRLGALGATSTDVWQAVVAKWHTHTKISLALGELTDVSSVANVPSETDSVKIGLAHCRDHAAWPEMLDAIYDQLPDRVQRVAVYYADAHLANSPSLGNVLDVALQFGCQTFLVDTFDKSAGSVFHHMSSSQLTSLRQRLHRAGLQFALAGSLRATDLSAVVRIHPDIVAVRGAVCHRDRTGEIDAQLIQSFRKQMVRLGKTSRTEVLSRS